MKRLLSILLLFTLLIPGVQAAPAPSDAITLTADAAVLMEKETGTVLYEQQPHKQLEPASVTKIMTLLLIMEAVDSGRISLEDLVPVSAHAAGMGGSQVYLKEGEQMTVSEMIKCVTVVSGNDCATALAEFHSGSEEAFVQAMNQRAQELGMADTHFVNCTGLPAQGHLTTAYDIALMSQELILKHPDIRAYTTIWMDSIRGGEFGLTNTNRLVRFYQGTTGLKTGSTDGALFCMSATAERNGMELIAVVMKSPTSADRFEDAKTLLDYGFANYTLMDVHPDTALPPVPVLLGAVDQVQPKLAGSCRLLLRKGEENQLTTQVVLCENVEAPVEESQTLGRLEVSVGGALRDSIPIVAAQGVERLTLPGIFGQMLRQLLMAG